jgi:ribosome-associated translation inhibitor RaiA
MVAEIPVNLSRLSYMFLIECKIALCGHDHHLRATKEDNDKYILIDKA